jgi:hypothetical protein
VIRIATDRLDESAKRFQNMGLPQSLCHLIAIRTTLQGKARDYQIVDRKPLHDRYKAIIVDVTAIRQINWKFPRRDGLEVRTTFEAGVTNGWEV